MAVTVVSFRWLEILEKEFDKNFVDLDLIIGDLDGEEPDLVYSARQKLAGLSSCFAQLTHKAQTIFQNSAKTEAELVDLRAELVQCKTRQEVLEEDCRSLVLQLHSLQLERVPSNQNPEQYKEKIDKALKHSPTKGSYSEELAQKQNGETKRLRHELAQFVAENAALRASVLALTSEVYGARLAAKYLDKELAGRIQQLQLLGKDMRTDLRDKLWRQLESEILLHRHKTVIRACRNRPHMDLLRPARHLGGVSNSVKSESALTNGHATSGTTTEEPTGIAGEKRVVVVKRQEGQGLGISITGGREHGVPILISELEEGGPAAESRSLYVGDAILSVDDISLENANHYEAVKILTSLENDQVRLLVQFIAVDDDEETSLSEDLYGYRYRFFDTEVMDSTDVLGLHPVHTDSAHSQATPTAPRTPESVSPFRNSDGHHHLCLPPPSPKFDNLEKNDRLNIDLFGRRFCTDLDCKEKPKTLEEHVPLPPPSPAPQHPVSSTPPPPKIENPEPKKERAKLSSVKKNSVLGLDETIFAGLEDTSTLDNIVKSFSEDDFSCLEAADSGLHSGVDSGLYSSDETRARVASPEESIRNVTPERRPLPLPLLSPDNSPEKLELRTLHQIFDRSFSSNLSSPHESTSFDDDIFSTEHSDDKNGNYLDNFRSKMNDMKNAYNPKKVQKYYPPKSMDDFMKKKKSIPEKRTKSLRKKESKGEKRRGREVSKVTDRFEESLLEYSVKDVGVEDALEATRRLSLQYGLRLPDARPPTPERCTKVIEGHFKQHLPTSERSGGTGQPQGLEKPRPFRTTRYDSFGDPDFGTPV